MPTRTDLSRISLRRDQILEAQFSPMPDAPAQLVRVPGFREFYELMKLMRERDQGTIRQMLANVDNANIDGGSP